MRSKLIFQITSPLITYGSNTCLQHFEDLSTYVVSTIIFNC